MKVVEALVALWLWIEVEISLYLPSYPTQVLEAYQFLKNFIKTTDNLSGSYN
jgi:hypothetical protein